MRQINLIGGFYRDPPWAAEDTVNWLPVVSKSGGARSETKLRGAPGLQFLDANVIPQEPLPARYVGGAVPDPLPEPFSFRFNVFNLPSGITPTQAEIDVNPALFTVIAGKQSVVFLFQNGRADLGPTTFRGLLDGDDVTGPIAVPASSEIAVVVSASPGQIIQVQSLNPVAPASSVTTFQVWNADNFTEAGEIVGGVFIPANSLGQITAPIRGMRNVEGFLFVVAGGKLYQVTAGGQAFDRGTIPGVDRVSMDYNQVAGGNQLAIDNGSSRYIFNTATNELTQVTDDQFPGSFAAEFLDGYLLGVEPFGRYWFWSDLADGLSYSSFDRAQAEARPDPIIALKVFNREAWVFGRDTTEVFVNTGQLNGTFQRASGTVLNVGCAGRFAVARSNAGLFWLGGDGRFYSANGYTPQAISTPPIEQAIRGLNWADCYAMTWEDEGHSVVYFGFPNGLTLGFDATTGFWHRRESQGLNGWRIGHLERWNGKWIAGDIYRGGLYELDWDTYDEDGEPLVCERTSGVFSDSQARLLFSSLELVMDTGTGDLGQKAVLQYSDDGGRNWTNWREGSMGALGEYTKRIRFHRLGASRQRVFRIRVSDPRRRDLISASLSVESTGA